MAVLQFGSKLLLFIVILPFKWLHLWQASGFMLHSLLSFYFIGSGFGSDADNPHLPHNHERNQVVYTGTHDNDTVRLFHAINFFQFVAGFVFLVGENVSRDSIYYTSLFLHNL